MTGAGISPCLMQRSLNGCGANLVSSGEGRLWAGSDQKIIGYGTFSYTNSSGKTTNWFMVGLAAQKNYISMYVNAVDDDGYVLKKYADRLGKAKVGSASISFKSVEDINLDILMELVDVAAKGID